MKQPLTSSLLSCTDFSVKLITSPVHHQWRKNGSWRSTQDQATSCPQRNETWDSKGSKHILHTIGKKQRSSIQQVRWSDIGTNAPKTPAMTSAMTHGSAVLGMKTPPRAVKTNETSAKTKKYVITICHTCALLASDPHSIRPQYFAKNDGYSTRRKRLRYHLTHQSDTGAYIA